jgi:hypothetical protein
VSECFFIKQNNEKESGDDIWYRDGEEKTEKNSDTFSYGI